MSRITGVGQTNPGGVPQPDEARLRNAVHGLESIFVQRLFQAMRETVPKDGITNGGAGEEIFTDLLDEKLSGLVPSRLEHDDLGQAIMRQLRGPHTDSTTPGSGTKVHDK
jgi:Rod binding domain-containing protein